MSESRWSPRRRGSLLLSLGVATLTALTALTAQAAPAATPGIAANPNAAATVRAEIKAGTLLKTHGMMRSCANGLYKLACLAEVATTAPHSTKALATTTPVGYGATDLEKAYNLSGGQSGTIAIIDAGAYPNLESDLATYRAQYGLPACTTASGCLKIADLHGGAPLTPGTDFLSQYIEEQVAVETALDVDMASAACPDCKIVELQLPDLDALAGSTADQQTTDFGIAVNTAASLGANAVSMSYQYPSDAFEETGTPGLDLFHPGMAVLASSGDSGYEGNVHNGWPNNLPWVTSVGGTSLYESADGKSFSQVAWAQAGSGCETDMPPAIGQPAAVSNYCGGHRAASDISAVADLNTGVAVYDTYAPFSGQPFNWIIVGGTSVSSPFVAGIYARAGNLSQVIGPNTLYMAPASTFTDVTVGANTPPNSGTGPAQLYTAGKGWDGPTGVGTPKGLTGF
ncbi:MAG TPA: peptidase S8 [Pseudonocardiaceae bacterium]|nr:peptidase S8 [Pseudonocardiaceae bacterium]